MKRISIIFALAVIVFGAYAQPKLVGHRGSGYGLENSEESFKKGVELGYHYLETDIKMTKDRRFVCSHDDDDTRLGGTKTIATSTLEELQSETLRQTRSGVTYTGRICSLEEYLQIIKDAGIGAVVELKWTTGINDNDQSNIPELIKAIDAMGMREKVIILTSMKKCLEYIRKNYPDITLQFLTGQYWKNHFDWCVEWNIDVDIQVGYFDKSTVKQYHDKGLKVNMWTTNDAAGYRTYGNMGCDFITTDRIDGNNLPDLDPSVTFPPNTTDYPEIEGVTIKGNYDITDESLAPQPTELAGKTIRKAVRMKDGWAILAVDSENIPTLLYYDGSDYSLMSLAGVEDGLSSLYNIAVTSDGKLFGCNLANVTNVAETTGTLKTYVWDNEKAEPRLLWKTSEFAQAGNWISGIVGEVMTVSGHENDLKAYISSRSASGTTYRICGYETKGTQIVNAVYAINNAVYTQANWGKYQLSTSPFSRNNIIVNSSSVTPSEYTFEWGGTRLPMTDYSAIPMSTHGISFFRYGEKVYGVFPTVSDSKELSYIVYDVTDGFDNMIAVTKEIKVGILAAEDTYFASAAKVKADGGVDISVYADGLGIHSALFNKANEVVAPVDLGLVLERKWILSNTTDNHPGHIDGSNAQQGTAVNGLFYVNDCSDKLIYIFDKTGCIGSIPGGSGFGCARDDAGNIVVRDDKLAGTTHNFIIYPAGARPESYGEAVRFEVEVPASGQTNFINASGDLLGDGGIIYLYPNGQNVVNIISVAGGQVSNVRASKEITLTGSTAGYVIPINNNSENWLYMVRSTGIYDYNGGVSTAVLTSRSSTTAPARNTTGGAAYIVEGGNRILIHNSGANYKGGFTVRDLTMDKVITSVGPIGNLGYGGEGNNSTFNWLIVERKGYADYILYQYCPSNGMAVYTLRNPNLGGVDVVAGNYGSDNFAIDVTGTEIIASESGLAIFDLAGKQIRKTSGKVIRTQGIETGMYVVRTDSGKAKKVVLR